MSTGGKIVIWAFLYLSSRVLCHVDCNNKKTLPVSWFHFLLMSLLKQCSLECDTFCCSIYLIDFGAWLLFERFVAAKFVGLSKSIWCSSIGAQYVHFPFPFSYGLKNLSSLCNWNIVVLYLWCRKFCHYDMSTGGWKFLYVLSGGIFCFGDKLSFLSFRFHYSLLQS